MGAVDRVPAGGRLAGAAPDARGRGEPVRGPARAVRPRRRGGADLAATGLDARNLILEITETALMEDVESTVDVLRQLKALGLQLAIDDFGTGFASLQYLRGFPIDILKIAKDDVDGVASASDDSTLARVIIDLGQSFRLRVVAEGIEHSHQLDRLIELGCDLGQGFYFARPAGPAAIERMLLEARTHPRIREARARRMPSRAVGSA